MASSSFAARYGASINWFPGHMAKTSRQLLEHGRRCDVILEVRDARTPFSSGNPLLGGLTAPGNPLHAKPRIVVLNKADLALESLQPRVVQALEEQEGGEVGGAVRAIHMCADARAGGKAPVRSVRRLLSLVDSLPSAGASKGFRAVGATMMVVGIPNVGKSSLINAVRAASKAHDTGRASVAPTPGHTRAVSALKVRHDPPLFLLDTPGVLMPRIPDVEVGMRLAVTAAMPAHTVPPLIQAEFLLYYLESVGAKWERWAGAGLGLARGYGKEEAGECLHDLAVRLGLLVPGGGPDLQSAARHMVGRFQEGSMGRYTLDYVAPSDPDGERETAAGGRTEGAGGMMMRTRAIGSAGGDGAARGTGEGGGGPSSSDDDGDDGDDGGEGEVEGGEGWKRAVLEAGAQTGTEEKRQADGERGREPAAAAAAVPAAAVVPGERAGAGGTPTPRGDGAAGNSNKPLSNRAMRKAAEAEAGGGARAGLSTRRA